MSNNETREERLNKTFIISSATQSRFIFILAQKPPFGRTLG